MSSQIRESLLFDDDDNDDDDFGSSSVAATGTGSCQLNNGDHNSSRKRRLARRKPRLVRTPLFGDLADFVSSRATLKRHFSSPHPSKNAFEESAGPVSRVPQSLATYHHHHHHHHQHNQQQQCPLQHYNQQRPASFHGRHKRLRTMSTFLALIGCDKSHAASHLSRVELLKRLVRAPMALALAFSFAIALTLTVFYAASFGHHQSNLNSNQYSNNGGLIRRHVTNTKVVSALNNNNRSHILSKVQTDCAVLVANAHGTGAIFKGVAYAEPPIGAFRFRKPRPLKKCKPQVEVPATRYRTPCMQLSAVTRRLEGAEDCLYLDVYSPLASVAASKFATGAGNDSNEQHDAESKQLLPVMVYAHGGFLTFGGSSGSISVSGSGPGLGGAVNWAPAKPSLALAKELNLVLVAVSYRLQALGFVALPGGLAEPNIGLWDQVAALGWVQRNIDAFGGDKRRVTLFGPDAGGALALALLTQPPASLIADLDSVESNWNDDNATLPQSKAATVTTSASTSVASYETKRQPTIEPENDNALNSTTGRKLQRRYGGRRSPEPGLHSLMAKAWLVDPAVHYQFGVELAHQHYARLLQVPLASCATNRSSAEDITARTTDTTEAAVEKEEREEKERDTTINKCMRALPAEQLIRAFLAADDATFRLDDENSMPIHGMFADQLIVVDNQLVHAAHPFELRRPEATTTTTTTTTTTANAGDYRRHQLAADSGSAAIDVLIGSAAQAVEFWPCPAKAANWTWSDFRRYVGTSLNSFSTDAYDKISNLYAIPDASNITDNADPTERYLTIVSDIRQVCPASELANALSQRKHRVQRYVVETRPSRPVRLLAAVPDSSLSSKQQQSLSSPLHCIPQAVDDDAADMLLHEDADEGDATAPLKTDEISAEQGPSQSEPRKSTKTTTSCQPTIDERGAEHWAQFAFHAWDLIAFFGFEPLTGFEPDASDLAFQARIRRMVAEFVHAPTKSPVKHNNLNNNNNKIQVFRQNASVELVDSYKLAECKLLKRQLGDAYAWVS